MYKPIKSEKNVSLDTIGIKRLVDENGTKKAYVKKRRAKAITKAVMHRMFGLQSELNGDYRQAYMCNEYLFQNGTKITSNYCAKKCCTVCNRIKGAQHLHKYGYRILDLKDIYLVTLTDKNVGRGELESNVDQMYKALSRIKKNFYYHKMKIHGFRSFECTFSFEAGFNPHFHFIVQGKENAELLLRLWLAQFPNASVKGQNIKKVGNTKKDLLEVFKYIAKPITKGYYSPAAYDEIMRTVKRHRTTEALGCIRGRLENDTDTISLNELEAQEITFKGNTVQLWQYVNELYDYVNFEGELLIDEPLDLKTLNAIEIINKSIIAENEKEQKLSNTEAFAKARSRIKEVEFF